MAGSTRSLPFRRNPEFKNCARTYGSLRIYAHSPTDLGSVNRASEINSYCFRQTYRDLKHTLVHEYIHSRTFLLLNKNPLPKWAWEGVAVALSGELHNAEFRNEALGELERAGAIDLCSEKDLEKKPYHFGGLVFQFFEKKDPGFIREVIRQFKNSNVVDIRKQMLGMISGCKVSLSDLIEKDRIDHGK